MKKQVRVHKGSRVTRAKEPVHPRQVPAQLDIAPSAALLLAYLYKETNKGKTAYQISVRSLAEEVCLAIKTTHDNTKFLKSILRCIKVDVLPQPKPCVYELTATGIRAAAALPSFKELHGRALSDLTARSVADELGRLKEARTGAPA